MCCDIENRKFNFYRTIMRKNKKIHQKQNIENIQESLNKRWIQVINATCPL